MTWTTPIVLISAAILIVLVIRALLVLRREGDAPRGAEPGQGHHVIDSSYYSGGGGGGHQSSFRVLRDPQDYAKGFVPKHLNTQKDRQDGDHR